MHTEYRANQRASPRDTNRLAWIRISTSKMASAKRTGNEVAMKGKQTEAGGRSHGPPWDRRVTGDEMRALTGPLRHRLSTHLERILVECGCF